MPGKQVFIEQNQGDGIVDGFWLYTPKNYVPNRKYPVILFLTGGRTAATGNTYDAKEHGPSKFLFDSNINKEVQPFLRDSFLIINPHMKVGGVEVRQWYQHSDELIQSLQLLTSEYSVDKNRVYITGISRGGHGAWGVAKRYPEYFAAISPLAGELSCKSNCEEIDWIPKWIFHGDQDASISINHSWDMIHRMESQGINFHHYKNLDIQAEDLTYPFLFTQFDGRGHDIWDDVYADANFYQWLLKQNIAKR